MLALLCVAGGILWLVHADAWDLGRRSPILNYDTAQYALAAREIATHGRIQTTFALPLELSRHARPPWPLAVIQPGLLSLEAAILRAAPPRLEIAGRSIAQWQRPDQREWLLVPIPFTCFILIGAVLGLATLKILRAHAPETPPLAAALAGGLVGLAFLLDPEAQHFAVAPFTELPFTLGLVGAVAMLALGIAGARPFVFGLVLGVTGTFRANMLWLAPLFILAAAWSAAPGRRGRVVGLAALAFVLPLAPWWIYKWQAFGHPGWDLTRYVVWDGIAGHTWFSIYHLPDLLDLPRGLEAASLLAAKTLRNLPGLALALLTGPRALWIGALALWCAIARPPRPLLAAALVILAGLGLGAVTAAVSIPWLRYVFPARVPLEAAGLLAALALAGRLRELAGSDRAVRLVRVGLAALALAWGGLMTARGNVEAHRASLERGVPGTLTLLQIGVLMNREIPAGEAVMSNLGPALAWHARRPVVHLALSLADVESCRRFLDVRHVLLVFREPSKAWPGWRDVVADPERAREDPELNVDRARVWQSADGFSIVWLELGPQGPRLAAGGATRRP